MNKEVRALGRILATRSLTPEELELVVGGDNFEAITVDASPDTVCQGRADDCGNDG